MEMWRIPRESVECGESSKWKKSLAFHWSRDILGHNRCLLQASQVLHTRQHTARVGVSKSSCSRMTSIISGGILYDRSRESGLMNGGRRDRRIDFRNALGAVSSLMGWTLNAGDA